MVKTLRGENEVDNDQLIDHENLLVLSIDQKGIIVHFNRECERLSGYRRSEVLNKNIFEFFIPQDYYDKWNDMIASILDHTSIPDFELPFLTRNGQKIMILWSDFPVRNDRGTVGDIGLVGKPVHSPFKEKIMPTIIPTLKQNTASSLKKVPLDQSVDTIIFEFGNKKIWFKNPSDSTKAIDRHRTAQATSKQTNQKHSQEKKHRMQQDPLKTERYSPVPHRTFKKTGSSQEKKSHITKTSTEKKSKIIAAKRHVKHPPSKRETPRKDAKNVHDPDQKLPQRETLETYLGAFDKAIHTIETLEQQNRELENTLEHTLHKLQPTESSSKEHTPVESQQDENTPREPLLSQTHDSKVPGRIERAEKSLVKQYDTTHLPPVIQKKKVRIPKMPATLTSSGELPIFQEIATLPPSSIPLPTADSKQQLLKEKVQTGDIDRQANLLGELEGHAEGSTQQNKRITKANKSLVKQYRFRKREGKQKNTTMEDQEPLLHTPDRVSPEPEGLNKEVFSAFNKTIRSIQQYSDEERKDRPKREGFFKKPVIRLKKRTGRTASEVQSATGDQVSLDKKIKAFFSRSSYFLLDCVGINDKREEFRLMMKELNAHRAELSNVEAQVNADKQELNLRRKEYCIWRKKLEVLEEEVENRRIDVVTTEKMFNDQFLSSLNEGFQTTSLLDPSVDRSDSDEEESSHDLINDIQDCAAIIQRGKFKQVNQSLLSLLGYETNELLDKSVINFVDSEHFADIKQHYLNRLKGLDAASYQAVFLSKEQNELPLLVNTRPTVFNGEQAELAVFRKLEQDFEEEFSSENTS